MSVRESCWMLVSAFLFALMALFAKLSTAYYGVMEIIFYRSVLGVLFVGAEGGRFRSAHKVGVELRLGVAAAACALCEGIALAAGAVVIVTAAVVASAGSALVIIHELFLFCFDFRSLLLFCRRGPGRTLFFGRSGFGGFFRPLRFCRLARAYGAVGRGAVGAQLNAEQLIHTDFCINTVPCGIVIADGFRAMALCKQL